jgi:hypothetical protein
MIPFAEDEDTSAEKSEKEKERDWASGFYLHGKIVHAKDIIKKNKKGKVNLIIDHFDRNQTYC